MKKLGLILSFCMILAVCCSVPALADQTVWSGFDAQAVKNGTDSHWTTNLSVHTHATNGKGLIAPAGNGTMSSSDSGYSSTTVSKREWNSLKAKSEITSVMAEKYEVSFKLTGIEGSYPTTFGGWYVYLRSSTVTNYLDNRFAIILRRSHSGTTQIGLKRATRGATNDEYLPINVAGVTLLDTDIKVVDSFADNIIKIYATDSDGVYQLIGTVTLNLTTNSATLANAAGSTLTRTGYGETISGTSSTPMFISAENSIMLSHLTVKYPVSEPAGVTVSSPAGVYVGYPEIELSTTDSEGVIYYTLDGTNPIENGTEYTGGLIDLSDFDIPGTVTLKVAEELGGVFTNVETYVYTLYPENATYALDTSEVSAGTSEDFGYNNKFITHGDDGFAAENAINSWTHVYSKFGIPVDAGGMEYRFKAENMSTDGATHFGMFVSLQSPSKVNMTSNTIPYLYLGRDKIGFRNANGWGVGACTTMGYADGVTFDEGTHYLRIVNRFDDESEVYIDGILVATVEIEDDTMTVTNGDGESITREGVTPATNLVYTNIAIYKGSQYTIVRDFTVLYPDEEHEQSTDRTELGELIEEVEALESSDYSSATFDALMEALEDAKEVYGNFFVFQEGVDEAYNTLLVAKNNLAEPEVVNLIVSCTDVTVYGKGTLSVIAEYDNGLEAELTEGVTYTSLSEDIAVVDGDTVKGIAAGTATIKAEYEGVEEEIAVEVTPIPLAVVENTTDVPVSITEAEAGNYEKVFYAYGNTNLTVPAGSDGEVDIYIRAEGAGNATVKVNGAVAEEINVSDLQNYKVTASLEKGLNTVEIITEAEVSGVYVQKIAGTLPVNLLTGIALSQTAYTFVVTDEGADLPTVTAHYYSGGTDTVSATFVSNNPGIAAVENGKIVPAGNDGEAIITVTYAEEGITKQAEINVSVTLSENIVVLSSITAAEANATKGYAEGAYSESFKPQFAIDGENGTVWTSGGAGEYLAGHEEDAAVYLAVKLDGLHSVDRVMLSLADDTVDTDKILGVWVDTRRMDGLSPYANEVVFVEKADLTVLTDDIGKTVKLVFDEPQIVQYMAVAFDKDAEVSVREIKLYEDTNVEATEDAESLTFEGVGITDCKITLTQGDEVAVVLKKNYPRLDSVTVEAYTPASTESDIAWIEGGVLKTDLSGESTITTTVAGLTATLEVTVLPMADITCLNPDAFINMRAGDEAAIELSEGLFKIRYLSENTSVATVDSEGNVTAEGNGRTRIKIYSEVSGTEPVYISVNVGDAAEAGLLVSEDFEGSTNLPADWSYFIWQGENKQSIENINGENYMNIGGDWIGGAIHNTLITAEKYTVEANAGVTGTDGIIYLRLPEICSPVLSYTGETDYATSGRRYGRDGIAFNLLGNSSFGITFRTKDTDSNGYPKAVNIAVPVPAEVSFPDNTFADFRFDDTGDNVYASVNGQIVCKIVFTTVETDPADSARVLADGYVEDATGKKLGVFNDVTLPGGNYRVGFGSRGKTLYLNDLEVTTNPLPEIANAEEFKVVELGCEPVKISATQFNESFSGSVEYESADSSVATVDTEGKVSFVGRGTTVIYVYTPAGNLHVQVTVLGTEDIREIVTELMNTADYTAATALYAELEETYNLDFSAITSEELSDRLKEEITLDGAEAFDTLADIENKTLFVKKIAEIAVATSVTGSGDKLEKAVMPCKTDLELDTTDYDKIKSDNTRGEMWKAFYKEIKGTHINSAIIKEKFESYAEDYLEKYLEGDKPDVGGGSDRDGSMTYVDTAATVQPAKSYFTDLTSAHWAKSYIESLAQQGIISGYADGTVNPDGRITREEAVTVIIKAFIKKTSEGTLVVGDPSSEWAVPYLVSAKENGLLVGDDKGFMNGKNNATRAEMAVLIARLMGITEGNTAALASFTDAQSIPEWSQSAFAALGEKGIIGGYEDGSLRPEGFITRAEFFTIIYRIIANN